MTALRFIDHFLGPDIHANRPAAAAVPKGAKYVCTTHGIIYSSDQTSWTTWATLGGTYTDEQARDAIGAALVAGSGMTITVDDAGDTITLASTGGGGGGGGSSYPLGSADKPPTSPNAKDDEFDGTSTVTWISTPTAPNAWDINTTRASHAYLKASGSALNTVGKYQAVPGGYPYTIVTKVGSTNRQDNHRGGGLILLPSTPSGSSSSHYLGYVSVSNVRNLARLTATLAGAFSSSSTGVSVGYGPPVYLKMTVNSATSVSTWFSFDGFTWIAIETAVNPGFTPAFMGVANSEHTANNGVEAYFDFFRVT